MTLLSDQVLTRRKTTVEPRMTTSKRARAKGQQTNVEPLPVSVATVGRKNVGDGSAACIWNWVGSVFGYDSVVGKGVAVGKRTKVGVTVGQPPPSARPVCVADSESSPSARMKTTRHAHWRILVSGGLNRRKCFTQFVLSKNCLPPAWLKRSSVIERTPGGCYSLIPRISSNSALLKSITILSPI